MLTNLSNFSHNVTQKCYVWRPFHPSELQNFPNTTLIARGSGNNYGDAAFNTHGQVLLTEALHHFIAFNKQDGTLTAESGLTLAEILKVIVPAGWFLPVTPGTQFVTLGGCIAADVHGKNHHHLGSFNQHVEWLDLITATKEIVRCSATENTELFYATIGGMGLTGLIVRAAIKLIPIDTSFLSIKHHATTSLKETMNHLISPEYDDEYSVAWLDTQTHHRAIVMTAHHLSSTEAPTTLKTHTSKKIKTVPPIFPKNLLNRQTIKWFNQFYWHHQKNKTSFISHYESYFYPLDTLKHWHRFYGTPGFLQYQCVFPSETSENGIQQILTYLQKENYPIFLAVLKRFGSSKKGMLSFPIPGFTLALDLPIKKKILLNMLNKMDEIVIALGGKIYLAKDNRLKPDNFRRMYPEYTEWLAIKNKWDPENRFQSNLSRRLLMDTC